MRAAPVIRCTAIRDRDGVCVAFDLTSDEALEQALRSGRYRWIEWSKS